MTYEQLMEVQNNCVSMRGDTSKLLAWINELGIRTEDFARLMDDLGDAASHFQDIPDIDTDLLWGAIYAAGFELGVRFQQAREVIV